jgi:CRP-like cAMP-binding protein
MSEQLAHRNLLLGSLSSKDLARLLPHLRPYRTSEGEELHCRSSSDPDVFFPVDAVSSLIVLGADGSCVEVAVVGREGMVGLPVFINSEAVAFDAMTQVTGDGLKMPRRILRREIRRADDFAHRLEEYTETILLAVGQASLCARMHSPVERCARWILAREDRASGGEFRLTQEFLGRMLGLRRATVTMAAASLKRRKLIDYSRGRVRVVSRKGLEQAACECYGHIREEFQALRQEWRQGS